MSTNFFTLSYKALYSYQNVKTYLTFRVLEPLFHYLFFASMAYYIMGSEYLNFIVIGNVIYMMVHTLIINITVMLRFDKIYGTLPYNIGSPTSTLAIMFKRLLIPIIDTILTFIISSLTVFFIFNIKIEFEMIFPLLLLIITIIFSLCGIGIIISGLGVVFKNVNLFLNLSLGLFQIFCGVNFPLSVLPNGIETIARCIPFTNGLLGIREVITNSAEMNTVLPYIYFEISIGVVTFIISIFVIKTLEILSRKKGVLFFD
ncbi:ABC transporter permease [Cytobacillus kochii]|uniref:ABC transporter permease n=1 Tax=Cytobacillus kochii TaxID=859143 RepID=UPI001CD72842|nr:ABC transporter permease [Cytobacillus kochii]